MNCCLCDENNHGQRIYVSGGNEYRTKMGSANLELGTGIKSVCYYILKPMLNLNTVFIYTKNFTYSYFHLMKILYNYLKSNLKSVNMNLYAILGQSKFYIVCLLFFSPQKRPSSSG